MAEGRGTTTVRVPGMQKAFELGDWVQDVIHSTSQFATTQSTEVAALTGKAGESLPGATTTQTIRQSTLPRSGANGLPPGWMMYVYSIRIFLGTNRATGISIADARDVYNNTLFSFKIQSKVKSQGPIYRYPQGADLFITTTANATTYVSNGQPSPRHAEAYIIPYELEPGVPFDSAFNFAAALAQSAVLNVEVALAGLLQRPVT